MTNVTNTIYKRDIRFDTGVAAGQCKGSYSGSHAWWRHPSQAEDKCHFCPASKPAQEDTCIIAENFLQPIWSPSDELLFKVEKLAEKS